MSDQTTGSNQNYNQNIADNLISEQPTISNEYFRKDGTLFSEMFFKNKKLDSDGILKEFDEKGNLVKETTFNKIGLTNTESYIKTNGFRIDGSQAIAIVEKERDEQKCSADINPPNNLPKNFASGKEYWVVICGNYAGMIAGGKLDYKIYVIEPDSGKLIAGPCDPNNIAKGDECGVSNFWSNFIPK